MSLPTFSLALHLATPLSDAIGESGNFALDDVLALE